MVRFTVPMAKNGQCNVMQQHAHTLKTPLSNHGSYANRKTTISYFFLKTSVIIRIRKFQPKKIADTWNIYGKIFVKDLHNHVDQIKKSSDLDKC